MSDLMDVLLADGRRLSERRAAPPPMPATRADQIIAEGDHKRVSYRRLNPDADTTMVFGAQVGYLHEQVRSLCREAEALNVQRDRALNYERLHIDALGGEVWCGFTYTPGEEPRVYGPPENCHEGSPEELEVCEVWVNGRDVAGALSAAVADQIEAAVMLKAREVEPE